MSYLDVIFDDKFLAVYVALGVILVVAVAHDIITKEKKMPEQKETEQIYRCVKCSETTSTILKPERLCVDCVDEIKQNAITMLDLLVKWDGYADIADDVPGELRKDTQYLVRDLRY